MPNASFGDRPIARDPACSRSRSAEFIAQQHSAPMVGRMSRLDQLGTQRPQQCTAGFNLRRNLGHWIGQAALRVLLKAPRLR